MPKTNFIRLKCYNPITTQGERERHINVHQIVCIEELTIYTLNDNRIKGLKTRITLSSGEILDVKESNIELQKIIENEN